MNDAAPGLYFLAAPSAGSALPETAGPFQFGAAGHLASRARRNGWRLFLDGILTHGRLSGEPDAEAALRAFLESGFEALQAGLEGFYNIVLFHPEQRRAHFVSDPLGTRPWYLYRRGGIVAAAPTPVAFADWDLPMTLDRLELYHNFRYLHSSLGRTLAQEVECLLPGTRYDLNLAPDGPSFSQHRYQSFDHRPDRSITFEESVERMKTFFGDVVHRIRTHPRLEDLPIHLALTAGLDSRHILGELRDQGRPPDALRHVRMEEADFAPVRQMADGLGIPLIASDITDLDWPRLLRRWAHRSAGLLHVRQVYIWAMAKDMPPGGALGFSGYLMDWLVAINPWVDLPEGREAVEHVQNQFYTHSGMLSLLLPGASELAERSETRLRSFAEPFNGPEWYRAIVLATHHRGLHHIGPLDAKFADDAFVFPPGAHRDSLDYFRTVPRAVGGNRRARLEAMRRYFPELAAYPDDKGRPYSEYDSYMNPDSSLTQYVRPWIEALGSGFRKDPAPETWHARLRRFPALQRVHRRVVHDGALVRDGYVRSAGARASWGLLRAGGYQAWPLMTLLTAEVAYRVLVRGEAPDDVVGWLFD